MYNNVSTYICLPKGAYKYMYIFLKSEQYSDFLRTTHPAQNLNISEEKYTYNTSLNILTLCFYEKIISCSIFIMKFSIKIVIFRVYVYYLYSEI